MIYQSDSLDTKFQIILVRLEIFKKENKGINKKGGDIEGYLEEFCRWQSKQNPKTSSHPDHWDHGLLLTGVNLYDGLKKYSSVIGDYDSYYLCTLDMLFSSNHNIHKSSCGLFFRLQTL